MDTVIVVVLFVAVIALCMYGWGRRVGYQRGYEQATLEAPLRLRGKALETGKCPVCDRSQS